MASSLLSARCLRFAQLKPWISSVLGGPFCVCLPQGEIQSLLIKREREKKTKKERNTSWHVGTAVIGVIEWQENVEHVIFPYKFQVAISWILVACGHVTELQKNKNGWHMSLPVESGPWGVIDKFAECTGRRGQQGLGLGSSPSPSQSVRMWAASHYSSISFCQASTNVLRYVTWRPFS